MVGSALFSYLGAVHHWWPKMYGKMYNEGQARFWTIMTFIGFNITFLPQFLLGTRGMPRRYFDYAPQFEFLNQVSTIGSVIVGLSIVAVFWNLMRSFKNGKKAPPNPWGGVTLEWQCASPPTPHNFETAPRVAIPTTWRRTASCRMKKAMCLSTQVSMIRSFTKSKSRRHNHES